MHVIFNVGAAVIVCAVLLAGPSGAEAAGVDRLEEVERMATGDSPWYMVLSPDGSELYVVNIGPIPRTIGNRGDVAVVDADSRAVVATIELGVGFAEWIDVVPDGSRAYVAVSKAGTVVSTGENHVAVIDTAERRIIAEIPIPGSSHGPTAIAASPDGRRVYVTHRGDGQVFVIDSDPSSATYHELIDTLTTGGQPTGLAFSPGGERLYVASRRTPAEIAVVDADASSQDFHTILDRIDPQIGPSGGTTNVIVTPDGGRLYATYQESNSISVIDTSSNQVSELVPTSGDSLEGLALSSDGTAAYVIGRNNDRMLVVDTDPASATFHTELGSVPVGSTPAEVVFQPSSAAVAYVSNPLDHTVSIVDVAPAPDLLIERVDAGGLSGDWQSLRVAGRVTAEVTNAGDEPTDGPFDVTFFEDRNFNGTFEANVDELLGVVRRGGLEAGDAATVTANVSSTVLFRDNLVHVFVDSGDEVAETNETNNVRNSGLGCQRQPPSADFSVAVQYQALRGFEVVSTPMVVQMTDDNGDGRIDDADTPDIVVPRYREGLDQFDGGPIAVVDGLTGATHFETDFDHLVRVLCEIAVGDIDGDGAPEVVAPLHQREQLVAFEHDGKVKWVSDVHPLAGRGDAGGAVSLANLTGDDRPEIVIGANVYDASGALLADGSQTTGRSGYQLYTSVSAVADIDLDGRAEVVAGPSAFELDGPTIAVDWVRPDVPDGFVGIANFDGDDEAEIVVVSGGAIFLLNHDGSNAEVWNGGGGPSVLPGGGEGGAPTIADYDGDGLPEVGVAGLTRYAVFDTDGSLMWSAPTIDASSRVTGSTPFDFDGDGRVEVVYRDEEHLFVYEGATGAVLLQRALRSGTATELPVIADVDGDGNAEVLVTSGDNSPRTEEDTGVYVFESAEDSWVATRRIWNQHAYHITNVGDDGTIPAVERHHWMYPEGAPFNSFRQNVLPDPEPFFTPDLTASFVSFFCSDAVPRVTARIGNGGSATAGPGIPVSFYDGDPRAGGRLLATVATTFPMPPGLFEDVALALPASFDCTRALWVMADDAGGMAGTQSECREDNNLHHARVQLLASSFVDVTLDVETSYSDTTFNRAQDTVAFMVEARNIGRAPIDPPLLMVFDGFSAPSLVLRNADGLRDDGDPFLVLADRTDETPTLEPGDSTARRLVLVEDPRRFKVGFELLWLALGNRPPYFTSFPATTAVANRSYRYDARAVDPDDQPVTFHLRSAPPAMTVNPTTGTVTWLPGGAEIGAHSVTLVASDPRGAEASQRFAVEVVAETVNRPPLFTSSPPAHASVGAAYRYRAAAVDADLDPMTFSKLAGPADLTVDPDGLVQWGFALPGEYPVGVRVEDGRGGYADQNWVLTVGSPPSNPHAPSLFGTPPTIAAVGSRYLYQPFASDPDPGDVLTFSLDASPAGMSIDPVTGRITWYPGELQVGLHAVVLVVDDGNGGSATQAWNVEVFLEPPNRPPVIESVPDLIAVVGVEYRYPAFARDPEGAEVTFELVDPPAGMVIDPVTGLLTWTPAMPGTVTVAIKAVDPSGAFGSQVYDLAASPPNNAPSITSDPVVNAIVGGIYRYDVEADDPDGHTLGYRIDTGPVGMTIDSRSGLVTWRPSAAQVGDNPVTVAVDDGHGGSASQSFVVAVATDGEPPVVEISAAPDPAPIHDPVRVCVQATDNVGVTARTLTADGEAVTLEASGCGTLTPDALGSILLDATAADAAGNEGFATRELRVVDPGDTEEPVITLIRPLPDSELTAPADIVASITDNQPETLTWEVRMARADGGELRTIATGEGEVIEGVIATVDTTLLANDSYEFEIVAGDGIQATIVDFRYSVSSDLKLGNFRLDFTDLVIPVAGIPLVITRQYDTLDLSPGDFGVGWRLGLPGRVADSAREDPLQPFTITTRVYVTRPDGRRVGFTFQPRSAGFFGVFPGFRPDPGVTDRLEVEQELLFESGGLFFDFGDYYNPRLYFFTTQNGLRYTIDEFDGLHQIADAQRNTIEVRDDGLFSSTGISLGFERDDEGRIVRVIEPDDPNDAAPPGELRYSYDDDGNLVQSVDQLGNATDYFYEQSRFPNYLTRVVDPLGTPLVRTVYDEDGRFIGQCGAGGDPALLDGDPATPVEGCTEFCPDVAAAIQTIVDARGFRTDLILDDRGNVLTERRWLALDQTEFVDTVRSYDEGGRLLTETDPENNTTLFFYDERGNEIRREEPDGRAWTMTFNEANRVTSQCDPDGNCVALDYDDTGSLIRLTNPLGDVTRFTYYPNGQRQDIIDANGSTWTATYDSRGYLTEISYPAGGSETFVNNAAGRVVQRTDREGRRIDYTYDARGNIRTETWVSASPAVTFRYEYDAAGRMVSAQDPDSSYAMDYWPTGLLKTVRSASVNGSTPYTLTYGDRAADGSVVSGYDGNGNLTSVEDSFGGTTEYEYDALTRLAAIRQWGSPPTSVNEKLVTFEYDNANLLRTVRRYADLAATHPVGSTSLDYDCGVCPARIVGIRHVESTTGAVIDSLSFVRNGAGDIVQITDDSGDHAVAVDGDRKIIAVTYDPASERADEYYEYDGAGNRLASHRSVEYRYRYLSLPESSGSQLLEDDRFDYRYDNNGNLIGRTDRSSGEQTEYDYDHRNRLVEVRRYDSAGSLIKEAAYTYDSANRRIRSVEDGVVRKYVYDRGNPIILLDETGAVLKRRLYGTEVDSALAFEEQGESFWYLKDQVGTVRGILDGSGAVRARYTYDTFGALLWSSGDLSDDLRFQSREFSDLTGLGFFRARYYDAELGRFLSEDAVALQDYTFGLNQPLLFRDPSGQVTMVQYACQVSSFPMTVAGHLKPIIVWVAAMFNIVSGVLDDPDRASGAFAQAQAATHALLRQQVNAADDEALTSLREVVNDLYVDFPPWYDPRTWGKLVRGDAWDRLDALHSLGCGLVAP